MTLLLRRCKTALRGVAVLPQILHVLHDPAGRSPELAHRGRVHLRDRGAGTTVITLSLESVAPLLLEREHGGCGLCPRLLSLLVGEVARRGEEHALAHGCVALLLRGDRPGLRFQIERHRACAISLLRFCGRERDIRERSKHVPPEEAHGVAERLLVVTVPAPGVNRRSDFDGTPNGSAHGSDHGARLIVVVHVLDGSSPLLVGSRVRNVQLRARVDQSVVLVVALLQRESGRVLGRSRVRLHGLHDHGGADPVRAERLIDDRLHALRGGKAWLRPTLPAVHVLLLVLVHFPIPIPPPTPPTALLALAFPRRRRVEQLARLPCGLDRGSGEAGGVGTVLERGQDPNRMAQLVDRVRQGAKPLSIASVHRALGSCVCAIPPQSRHDLPRLVRWTQTSGSCLLALHAPLSARTTMLPGHTVTPSPPQSIQP